MIRVKGRPCWCGGPPAAAEVQCSHCGSSVHFTCLGLTVRGLAFVIDNKAVPYLCRSCVSLPRDLKNRLETNPKYPIQYFNSRVYDLVKSDDDAFLNQGTVASVASEIKLIRETQDLVLEGVEELRELFDQHQDNLVNLSQRRFAKPPEQKQSSQKITAPSPAPLLAKLPSYHGRSEAFLNMQTPVHFEGTRSQADQAGATPGHAVRAIPEEDLVDDEVAEIAEISQNED